MESHEVLFALVLSIVLAYPLCLCCYAFVSFWRTPKERIQCPKRSSSSCSDDRAIGTRRRGNRSRKRRQSSNPIREKEQPTLPHQPQLKHTSVRTVTSRRGQRTVVVVQKMPPFPCHRCREKSAKKGCSYRFCASCCRNCSNSVCGVHGTGFEASQERVLQACKEMAYELDLSFSHLSRYPRGIPDVGKQLELLNLSTNQLPALPEDIGALEGIKECYLQYNCLTRLPDSMCSMLCLQELDIKNNRLTALPDDIGCCRLLKVLALSNNNLRSLPASIGQLHFLEELNVHQNDLLYLPNEICQLSRLKYLYLGKNSLKALPSEFGGLHSLLELDLSDGRLTALPASICQCHSLDKLWLNNNQLRTLPNRLGDLTKLRELHIRSNHLRYIPATVLNMTLYTFTAQDNDFHQEMDLGKASTLDDSPPSSAVPSCQETAARAIIDFGLKWKDGVLPRHLEKYLHQSSYCTRCGGPFLSHCWRQVTFGVVVVTRVPVLHEECSLFCEEYRFEGAPAWPMLGEDDDGDFEDDDRDLDADLMW